MTESQSLTLAEKIEDIFTYHASDSDAAIAYAVLRHAAKVFAHTLIELTPPCADQTAAIRLLREAVMTANAAIALKGLI